MKVIYVITTVAVQVWQIERPTGQGPDGQDQGLTLKVKAKAKDSRFVLEDSSRPRTKAKDNNTGKNYITRLLFVDSY